MNGTMESLKTLVSALDEAKLDPNTGALAAAPTVLSCTATRGI
jgi:hypothetical protein